jgi:hypothetical protein
MEDYYSDELKSTPNSYLFFTGGINNQSGMYSRDMWSCYPTATNITSRYANTTPHVTHKVSQGFRTDDFT